MLFVTPQQEEERGDRTVLTTREQILAALSEAKDPIGHYLVLLEGTAPKKRVEIGAEPITIGRGSQQTLICDDRELSRAHLRISLANGAVVAEDMNSTNGTFVDEQRITGAVTLKDN